MFLIFDVLNYFCNFASAFKITIYGKYKYLKRREINIIYGFNTKANT